MTATTVKTKFTLGQVVATPGALDALKRNDRNALPYLNRHVRGDWGDLDDEDRTANDRAVAHEETAGTDDDRRSRVLSAYKLPDGSKLWIITEWDRSVTTILMPEEY